jgi:hypothetical protein
VFRCIVQIGYGGPVRECAVCSALVELDPTRNLRPGEFRGVGAPSRSAFGVDKLLSIVSAFDDRLCNSPNNAFHNSGAIKRSLGAS